MADEAGNFLTRKVGPVPGWVWLAGGSAALLIWRARSSSSSSSAAQQAAAQQAAAQAAAAYPTYPQGGGAPIYILPTGSGSTSSGNPSDTSGAPTPTTPAAAPTDVQFAYGNQLQDLENVNGQLVQRWTDQAGHWQQKTIATGLAPGAQVGYQLNQFGTPGRIDVTAPKAGGGLIHDWYTPQQGAWGTESVTGA